MTSYAMRVGYFDPGSDTYRVTMLWFESEDRRIIEAMARLELGHTCQFVGSHDRLDLPETIIVSNDLQELLRNMLRDVQNGDVHTVDMPLDVSVDSTVTGVLTDAVASTGGATDDALHR